MLDPDGDEAIGGAVRHEGRLPPARPLHPWICAVSQTSTQPRADHGRYAWSTNLVLTFSADDMHWHDLFYAIDPERFKEPEAVKRLEASERVQLLNDHPARVA